MTRRTYDDIHFVHVSVVLPDLSRDLSPVEGEVHFLPRLEHCRVHTLESGTYQLRLLEYRDTPCVVEPDRVLGLSVRSFLLGALHGMDHCRVEQTVIPGGDHSRAYDRPLG